MLTFVTTGRGGTERLNKFQCKHLAPVQNPNGPSDLYGIDQFTYVPEENYYICPEGKPLKYVGINPLNRTHLYYSTVKRCRDCTQKSRCTRGKYRTIAIHTCEPARQSAHALAKTPAFAISQRARRLGTGLSCDLANTDRAFSHPQAWAENRIKRAKGG